MKEIAEKWMSKNTFYCVRLRARLSPSTCLANQKKGRQGGGGSPWDPHQNLLVESCRDCEQGRDVEKGLDECPECGDNKISSQATCGRTECKAAYARKLIGYAKKKEGQTMDTPKREGAECEKCGKHFAPYRRGAVVVRSVCPDCLRATISKGCSARRAIGTKSSSERKPTPTAEELLLASLEAYGLREQLEETARAEFRTPLQQAVKFIADGLRKDGERKKCEG